MTNKYRNVKTVVDGHTFASKAEARRYSELRLLEKAGEISGLELQPRYPIVVNGFKICTYVGDFRYFDRASKTLITEDCKGMRTPIYRLKKKLVRAMYGFDIREVA